MQHILSNSICEFDHSIFLDYYGSIWSIGNNENGNLGKDVKNFPQLPSITKISSITNIKMISCGDYHTVCLNYDGDVFSFGLNNKVQLGIGKEYYEVKQTHIPQKINLPPCKQVSCGQNFTVCLTDLGTLYSFGENSYSQLGYGDNSSSYPQQIPNLNDIDFIICGIYRVLCKTYNNEYYGWGYGYYGELGNGKYNEVKPMKCKTWPDNVTSIKCGYFHTLFLTEEGKIYSCGLNTNGELGINDNTLEKLNIPTLIEDIPKIQRIECGSYTSLCIDINNNLWVFGENSSGQLGLEESENRYKPIIHPILSNIIDISSGGNHAFVKTFDNKIYAFGNNGCKQLGIKTSNIQKTPTQVFIDNEDIWCTNIQKSRQKSARK